MAETAAQRRATLAYRKKHTKTVTVTFFPSDMWMYEYLGEQEFAKAKYVKKLIKEDAEKKGVHQA